MFNPFKSWKERAEQKAELERLEEEDFKNRQAEWNAWQKFGQSIRSVLHEFENAGIDIAVFLKNFRKRDNNNDALVYEFDVDYGMHVKLEIRVWTPKCREFGSLTENTLTFYIDGKQVIADDLETMDKLMKKVIKLICRSADNLLEDNRDRINNWLSLEPAEDKPKELVRG